MYFIIKLFYWVYQEIIWENIWHFLRSFLFFENDGMRSEIFVTEQYLVYHLKGLCFVWCNHFFFCLFMYLFIHSSYLCFCWCYYTHTWFLGNIKWDAQVLIWGFRPSFRESFHLQAKSDVFQSSRKCQWHYLPMQVNICAWKINLSHEWLKICNVDSCW